MKDKENKDLELKQEGALDVRVSGNQSLPAGFDEVEEGDIKMPRLTVLQGMSEIVNEGKGKTGELANSLTKEVYGAEVDFIPLFMFKSRAQFDQGKGLVMLSRDNIKVTMAVGDYEKYIDSPVEEVPGSSWEGKTPPKFAEVYNFPVLLVNPPQKFPMVLAFMKTATKTAKEFLSMARYSGEDIFARVYTLRTKMEKNDKGTFALPIVEFKRRCENEEYAVAKKFFETLYRRKGDIEVELGEGTEETTA